MSLACCGGLVDEDDGENYSVLGGVKKDRTVTDRSPLIGMGVFFGLLFVLIAVAMANGDISRFINGYDDCGNVCGKNNTSTDKSIPCFGKDMTDKKYLLTKTRRMAFRNVTIQECVHDCKAEGGYVLFLNRCFMKTDVDLDEGKHFFESISEDFQQVWVEIIMMSFLALVFSVIMVFLLRYATAFVVWFVLIAIVAVMIGATIFFWIYWNQASNAAPGTQDNQAAGGLLFISIVFTLFTVVFLCVLLVFFKRIKLVIQLFKEAAKAIAAMPLLLVQPIYTFISLFVIFMCGCYFSSWIMSYASLTKDNSTDIVNNHQDKWLYEPTTFSVVIGAINWFAMLWIIQFVIGCQHLIIGGCVATWFFARNKNELGSPILTNSGNLVRYHLGTVAFGSLIIAIVELVKQLVRSMRNYMRDQKNIIVTILLCILASLLEWLEELLKYFSRNAYIMTAIYGLPFCKAGKKAFKLLFSNLFNVLAINSVGDYVLGFMKLFIVLFVTLIGYEVLRGKELHVLWLPLVVIALITYFIAHCFITVFEMAIDTIFLCFCEDCEQNDGLSKPYFMSRNLMEFVENSSKIMKSPWEAEQLQAWENGPKRLLQQGS